MSTSDVPAAVISQDYGLLLLGVALASLLFGCSLVPTYLYHDRYPHDRRFLQVLVYVVLALDACHLAAILSVAWHFLVRCFGDIKCTGQLPWQLLMEQALTMTITFIIQMFYSWRILTLTKSWAVFGGITFCCIVQWVTGLAYIGYISRNIIQFRTQWLTMVLVSMSVQIVADLLIAVVSFYTLRKQRSDYEQTRTILQKTIFFTLGTCLLPTVFALVRLNLFLLSRSVLLPSLFSLTLAKVYSNCLLVSLNARKHLRDMLSDVHMDPVVLTGTVGEDGSQSERSLRGVRAHRGPSFGDHAKNVSSLTM